MAGLARFLRKQGFEVLNLGYPSTRHDLAALCDIIHPRIDTFSHTIDGKLHIIGYSMGGLLARAYIHKHRPAQLGRVVMAGTPNGGSEVADFLKSWRLYRRLYGPAGQQLITDQSAFSALLGAVDYELGIIAGDRTVDPVSSYIIGKPGDGKVSIESTKLAGMKAHIVIPTNHTFMPSNRQMWEGALKFIREGEL